jgi:ATP-dependent DNA helicase RecG
MLKQESQYTEWKETWRDDCLHWVCGFANAQGGRLLLGVNDKGQVVGLPDAAKLLEDLPNKVRDLLGIVLDVNLHTEADLPYLELVVQAYPNPISYRGHYYMRSGSTLQELKGEALDRFLLGRHGRTWDGVPLPQFSLTDVSAPAMSRFRQLALRSGRLDAETLADTAVDSDAHLLDKLRLKEGAYFKRATALLFAADPQRFVTGAFVKVGFFESETELLYHDEVEGDLFHQVKNTLDLLLTKYLKAVISYDGIVRVETFPVPRAALREALLNALVHRDYSVTAPVQIRVYENRLRIWSPAVLPEGWTLETLLGAHSSSPYNPAIANAFFRAGEIETWGRGVVRIFAACEAAGSPKPVLRYDPYDMWLEFPFDPAYLRALRPGQGQSEQVTEQVARLLVALGGQTLSLQELMQSLGLSHRPNFLALHLRPALQAKLMQMTVPEKPNSRLQKYRLTQAGHGWVTGRG